DRTLDEGGEVNHLSDCCVERETAVENYYRFAPGIVGHGAAGLARRGIIPRSVHNAIRTQAPDHFGQQVDAVANLGIGTCRTAGEWQDPVIKTHAQAVVALLAKGAEQRMRDGAFSGARTSANRDDEWGRPAFWVTAHGAHDGISQLAISD